MANKELHVSVIVDAKTRQLDTLFKKLNHSESAIKKETTTQNKFTAAINKSSSAQGKLYKAIMGTHPALKTSVNLAQKLSKKLKGVAATYLGIMGAKTAITAIDTITGTENRLNYTNGGDEQATQAAIDKMYAASLKARTGYGDMMSNVGKSMALAGDKAFQGNIDNAIRFQEIMAKSYAIGGASAAEQSSSMYQMVQALGSGILQGDELRSVREGAPLAYKAIEEFAQGVLNTDESLKDLASQGKITSDMVVAAMLNAGDGIDKAFENTDMTIGQIFTNIKTVAMNALRPIQETINNFINSDNGQKLIEGITVGIQILGNVLNWFVDLAVAGANWVIDNWSWLQYVFYAIIGVLSYLGLIAVGMAIQTAIAGIAAWLPWIAGILAVVALIVYLASVSANGCEFIANLFMTVAQIIIGILMVVLVVYLACGVIMFTATTLVILAIIAVVALIVVAIAQYGEQIGQIVAGVVSVIWNILVTLLTTVIQVILIPFATAFDALANFIGNLFNDPIAAIIHLFETLANAVLGILKTIASGIDAIFGTSLAEGVQGWMDGISGKADELAARYGNGSYEQQSDIVGQLNDMMSDAVDTFTWDTSLAIQQGGEVGASVQNGINSVYDSITGFDLGDALGVDGMPNLNDSTYQLNPTASYDPSSVAGDIGDIADTGKTTAGNTGDIADAMKLTEEDLEYLRKVAEMEWKKEFTTAQITVNMNNNNNINGDQDLDGIVTKLSSMLYEELGAVANGVYV